jgi:hypothetical protein
MEWDPGFIDRSPMFEPLREYAAALRAHRSWPLRDDLQRLFDARAIGTAGGARLRLVAPSVETESYEQCIYLRGEMPHRDRDWHDLFNVLAWLAYPETKSALNAAHFAASDREREGRPSNARSTGRGPVRDALTLFDESGAIVTCGDPALLDDLRGFRWKRLFCENRERVRASMRFFVFGHALLEKALHPYVGMTAHAMLLAVDEAVTAALLARELETVDALAAREIAALTAPQALSPLPLLGVPGWWRDNEDESFYDDKSYFRPGRTRNRK